MMLPPPRRCKRALRLLGVTLTRRVTTPDQGIPSTCGAAPERERDTRRCVASTSVPGTSAHNSVSDPVDKRTSA